MVVDPITRHGSVAALVLSLLALWTLPLTPAQASGGAPDAELAELLDDLAGRAFKARLAAVETLQASGHPRALAILQATLENALHRRKSDSRLVVASGDQATLAISDAVTGEALGDAPPDALSRIRTNNSLRKALRGAVAALRLTHPEATARLAAAQELLGDPSPDTARLLREALAGEGDARVRSAMQLGLAAIDIGSADPAVRLAAIGTLEGSLHQEVRALLRSVADDANEPDPAVRAAAQSALADADRRLAIWEQVNNLYFGLSLGSVLLLAAVGLAITFGVMGVINMAHGEMVMLGAYTTYAVQQLMPGAVEWSLLVALPAAFAVTAAVGIGIERGVIRFLYGRPLETLLATFGISLILQQAVRSVFSPLNRSVESPAWMSGSLEVNAALSLTWNRLYVIVFALLVLAALATLLARSRFGLEIRAVTQNRAMASAMGIRTGRVDALTFGLGSGIAGLAGVALSQLTNVGPNMGQAYIVDSFMVVVFGGVGSLAGTFAGAMSLGVANKFLEPVTGTVLAKILVLVLIILFIQRRPRGLFALSGRAAEA